MKILIKLTAAFLIFHISITQLAALEETLILGRDDNWSRLSVQSNVITSPGRSGHFDLILKEQEYFQTSATDLLISFEDSDSVFYPIWGDYQPIETVETSPLVTGRGASSGVFYGTAGIELIPGNQAMFSPGAFWEDFSLEFMLNGSTLTSGETLLQWSGLLNFNGELYTQSLKCSIQNRKIVWSFNNMFLSGHSLLQEVQVESLTSLLPKKWYHTLLTFDSTSGLFEMFIDNQPEAVEYATPTGDSFSDFGLIVIGNINQTPVYIGQDFKGYLDEIRISSEIIRQPITESYSGSAGTVITTPLDLGWTNSLLLDFNVIEENPGDCKIFYFYRTADQLQTEHTLPGDWRPLKSETSFPNGTRGRYIQLKMELYADPETQESPVLSEIEINYAPDLPPGTPQLLRAISGNQKVELIWRKVTDSDLKGYKVYYGPASGHYSGTGNEWEPLFVEENRIVIENLENGTLYYFAVTAVDGAESAHESRFSAEVSARPAELYGDDNQ